MASHNNSPWIALSLSIGLPLAAAAFVFSLVAFLDARKSLRDAQDMVNAGSPPPDPSQIQAQLDMLADRAAKAALAQVQQDIQAQTASVQALIELQLDQSPAISPQPQAPAPEPEPEQEPEIIDPLVEAAVLTRRHCASCHSFDQGQRHRIGPNLWNVMDAKAGAKDGYRYSRAMTDSDLTWTREALVAYLENPRAFMPGTKMTYAGLPGLQAREGIAAFLESKRPATQEDGQGNTQ